MGDPVFTLFIRHKSVLEMQGSMNMITTAYIGVWDYEYNYNYITI